MPGDTSATLDYAPRPPAHRRLWFRRVVQGVVLGAVVIAAVRGGPVAWQRGSMLYWQSQCSGFVLPPEMVVYDNDEAEATRLLAQADYIDASKLPLVDFLGFSPMVPTVRRIRLRPHLVPIAAGHQPKCWRKFITHLRPAPANSPGVVLFLHERTSSFGIRRLVIVQRYGLDELTQMHRISDGIEVHATLLDPGGLSGDVQWAPKRGYGLARSGLVNRHRLRFYAGQPDPADAAAFSIRYEMGGEEGFLDGRLDDDGNGVRLTVRKRETTQQRIAD